jgi:putative transposase
VKKVPVVKIMTPPPAPVLAGVAFEATVVLADVAGAMREGLLAFSAAAGLVVMRQMLDAELASIVGAKHAKLPDRVGNWHGTTTGQVVLGGRTVSVERPRGRYVGDGGEVELDTWATFASDDLLRQVVVERMLAGVATRRHVDVAEPVGPVKERGVSKSAVSRRFVTATTAALKELMARDLTSLEVAVLMIDGLNVADQMIVVAMVITTDGTKIPVGLILGDTENAVVVTDLLADLVARGLRTNQGILAVIDGAKALRTGIVKVFGDQAVVQRCTLHKRRNVTGYLPVDQRDAVDKRLALAFAQPDPTKGLKACRDLAGQLDKTHPDAAASLREGLEEMFTVARLGVPARLRRTLTNTNCVESMISIIKSPADRVKNWGDGTMKKRWIAAGMLEAERSFRRVKGHADMPALVAAIHTEVLRRTATSQDTDRAVA